MLVWSEALEEHHIPEDELIQTRIEKLEQIRSLGKDPFAIERYARRASVVKPNGAETEVDPYTTDVVAAYESNEPKEGDQSAARVNVSLAGRIVSLRVMGKASFAHVQDRKGRIQLYFKKDDLGEDYELVKLLDLGDFVGAEGFVFRTRTGEVSVHVEKLTPLAKSIRPIPFGKEKGEQHWYGLQHVEQRYRLRHVDLVTNADSREVFRKRSAIIRSIREFYDSRGYLEVETPVLQSVAGGAAARPFLTYHNALEHEFHLRISLELYLKRLIVGGLERVYEIGRVFRNEGLSTRHNPEFTLLESYEAYANLEDVMELVEELFRHVCHALHGGTTFEHDGTVIDLSGTWRRLPMLEGIEQYAGIKPQAFETLDSALAAMEGVGLSTEQEHMVGGIIEKIHERFVQPNLIQPTFVTDFPIETSPLAKKCPDDPSMTRRFEVYVAKQEAGNAFSEINDPIDQRERFEQQGVMRAAGDEEAHPMDEDFLRALEYGMPPTGGLGIGIDRLVMIFCNQDNVRDVILFPQLRPES
ncbi:MAG: lysine--tRNA ligase [Armatimonadetes bacterium RBG_16_58_9]|nr:MAG: lysine--tRNA ligase [Armatimonadetes bacterium RBG_16_58_9]